MPDDATEYAMALRGFAEASKAAVDKFSTTAESFADMRPLSRVRGFGAGIAGSAILIELADAAAPRFEFPDLMVFAMLGAGILVIVAAVVAEATVRVAGIRRLDRQASALRAQAEELGRQSDSLIKGFPQRGSRSSLRI